MIILYFISHPISEIINSVFESEQTSLLLLISIISFARFLKKCHQLEILLRT